MAKIALKSVKNAGEMGVRSFDLVNYGILTAVKTQLSTAVSPVFIIGFEKFFRRFVRNFLYEIKKILNFITGKFVILSSIVF